MIVFFLFKFREITIFIFRKLIHRCNFTKINVFLYIYIFLFFLFHFQNKICIVVCLSLTVLIIVIVIVVLIVNQFSSVVEKRWSLHIFCSLAPIAWCVASMFVSFYLNIILFFVCLVIIIHIYSIFWFVLHCEYFWLQKQPYK